MDATTVTFAITTTPDGAMVGRQILERSLEISDTALWLITELILWLSAVLVVLDRWLISLYSFLFVGWAGDLRLIGLVVQEMCDASTTFFKTR